MGSGADDSYPSDFCDRLSSLVLLGRGGPHLLQRAYMRDVLAGSLVARAPPTMRTPGSSLRVVQWNINDLRWPSASSDNGVAKVAAYLLALDADVLVLQECGWATGQASAAMALHQSIKSSDAACRRGAAASSENPRVLELGRRLLAAGYALHESPVEYPTLVASCLPVQSAIALGLSRDLTSSTQGAGVLLSYCLSSPVQ